MTPRDKTKKVKVQVSKVGRANKKPNVKQLLSIKLGPFESKAANFGDATMTTSQGQNVWTLEQRIVTLFRAPHSTGGYDAYLTFSCGVTSLGYRTVPNDDLLLFVELKSNGGVLYHWDIPPIAINCGDTHNAIFFRVTVDPDIYPDTEFCTIGERGQAGHPNVYKC